MRKPRRPYANLEEYRLQRYYRECFDDPIPTGWPCLGCEGTGRHVTFGVETGTCPTCEGSGKGTKKAVLEEYRKEIQSWKEEVLLWKEKKEDLKRAFDKLTQREYRALAEYLTEEPDA